VGQILWWWAEFHVSNRHGRSAAAPLVAKPKLAHIYGATGNFHSSQPLLASLLLGRLDDPSNKRGLRRCNVHRRLHKFGDQVVAEAAAPAFVVAAVVVAAVVVAAVVVVSAAAAAAVAAAAVAAAIVVSAAFLLRAALVFLVI
jgi:hypothetical protein